MIREYKTMNITKNVDQGLVTITANGKILFEDIRSAVEAPCTINGYQKGFNILWDFHKATVSSISNEEIRNLVSIFELKGKEYGVNRIAFLVTRDVDFGIMHMFLAYGLHLPFRMAVFRDLSEAISWLAYENGT